jgi:hypothetical protein
MKSIQDLCIWLNKVEQALELTMSDKILSVEIFTDKSFRINKQNGDSAETIYDSSDLLLMQSIDINDLPYHDPNMFAEEIRETIVDKKEI